MQINPFLVTGYLSEDYFCDREKETSELLQSTLDGNNITLVSPRRMGKTGLILHTFEKLKRSKQVVAVYVDIFATRSLAEFIKAISESILREFPEKTSIGKKFWDFIKNLRPLVSYDPISGVPQIQINYQSEGEKQQTLHNIFQFLEAQNKRIVFAIDEFQQIRTYPESNIEALLRTEIQHLQNVSFIFCGSKRHMMLDIFSNNKNPFYASTRFLFLSEIDKEQYSHFIKTNFNRNGCIIHEDAVELILEWTKRHTYYTQSICNKVYSYRFDEVSVETIKKAFSEILEQQTSVYLQIRELVTSAQWNYLIAVAKEGTISQITAQKFLMTYKIGTASNSTRLMKSLVDKELILEKITVNQKEYCIYDVFFSQWLKTNF